MGQRLALGRRSPERGYTYVWVLLAVALLSMGLVAVAEVWAASARRERLQQLEWVGQQYVRAIQSYHGATPLGKASYPKSIDELVEDNRAGVTRRHLRQAYRNPFSGEVDFQWVRAADGGIRGVQCRVPTSRGGGLEDRMYLAQAGPAS